MVEKRVGIPRYMIPRLGVAVLKQIQVLPRLLVTPRTDLVETSCSEAARTLGFLAEWLSVC